MMLPTNWGKNNHGHLGALNGILINPHFTANSSSTAAFDQCFPQLIENGYSGLVFVGGAPFGVGLKNGTGSTNFWGSLFSDTPIWGFFYLL